MIVTTLAVVLTAAIARRSRAWRRSAWPDRRDCLAMATRVMCAHVLVRTAGFERTARWTTGGARTADPPPNQDQALRRGVIALSRVRRYAPFPGNCLSQSLALAGWLTRRGINAELQIGVQSVGGTFAAHAWVEHNGGVINDEADIAARFAPLRPAR
jgi:hypothetical protein